MFLSVRWSVGESVGPPFFSNMEKKQKINKKLKGEGRVGEGERRGGAGEEGEGERRGGEARKRSQRTHPLAVYQPCYPISFITGLIQLGLAHSFPI